MKKENENGKTFTYKIKFIDGVMFMSHSLSNLVDDLAEELREDKRKYHKSNLEYVTIKYGSLILKCIDCKKNY